MLRLPCLMLFSSMSLNPLLAADMAIGSEPSPVTGTVGLDAASSYIFRGVTVNPKAVLQPSLKLQAMGLTLGAWGNQALDAEDSEVKEELDLFASYDYSLGLATLSAGFTDYQYPDSEIERDQEIMLKVSLATLLNPSLAIYQGLAGALEETQYLEATVRQDLYQKGQLSLFSGAALGYLERKEGLDGFSHLTLNAGLSYAPFIASASYVVETDKDINPLEEQETFLLSTGASYTF